MSILSTADRRKKERKKKPDELLSSVVHETAVPAAVELLRDNKQFVFPSGTAWVMLVLSAEDIGGLSKKDSRNQEKGSIVELIGSDRIQTVATADMLAEEAFGIIPTLETLGRMEEYSLLTGANYAWAVVWQRTGGQLLVDLVADATFEQAKGVATGVLTLKEVVGDRAWADHSGLSEDESPTAQNISDEEVAKSSDVDTETIERVKDSDEDEGDPIFDEAPGDEVDATDGAPAFDGDAEPDFGDEPDFDEGGIVADDAIAEAEANVEVEDEPVFDEFDGDDGYEQDAGPVEGSPYLQDAPEGVILEDQDAARAAIARRFTSEELDLQIGLDEFETTFAIGAPMVQIAAPEGATEWLGDQIAQLNRQANADLAQLHWAHEDELRALYVSLMSEHAEQVLREVGTTHPDSPYKRLKEAAEADHQQRIAQKDEKVRKAKTEILEAHEAHAKKLAEQAAIQAEIQYKERNRSRVEREQLDAVAQIDKDLENDRSRNEQDILRVRRDHATLKMQTGQTRIFEVLCERQSEYFTAEQERLDRWKQEIQAIVDDNRKADIARTEALAEQQRTTDEIGALRREQEAQLEAARQEQEDRTRRYEAELKRSREEATANLRARDAEWQHSLELEKANTDQQASRVAELLGRIETAESSVARRYEARIAEMEVDKESYANELARASEIQGRYNKMIVGLFVALPILGGLAGYVGAMGMG